ncbi:MAG: NfeD family protein [Anaeroplasmataceae bacterium]
MILSSFSMTNMIYIWLAVSVLALIIEVLTTDLTSIWASLSALVTMFISIFVKILWIQLLVFAVITIILIFAVRPYVRKYFKRNEIKTNSDSLIGKYGNVIEDIIPGEVGVVKIDGKEWSAITEEGFIIKKGSKVLVLAIQGVKLIVKESLEEQICE